MVFGRVEAQLYQAAFATFGGSMGVRPLREDEERWYAQIRGNFMYPVADAFTSPPIATEGAQFPKPRPLRSVTSAGKEVVYLSSEESVGSSNGELSSWSNIFAEIKKKTPEKGVKFTEPEPKRPKITIKSFQTADSESAKEKSVAEQDVAKAVEAQRKAEERQEKRKKAEEEKRAFELEREQEQKKAMEKPVNVQESEVIRGSERRQGHEVVKPTHPAHAETHDRSKILTSKGSSRYTSSGASSGGAGSYNPNVIGAKDTVGDIYYKSYTEEERGDAPHQAPWSLKQKDTFQELGPCRDWFLNSFTPGEVNRQRAKTHEMLYRTLVLGEANARAANH
ncbi:uncharacterized protein LOC110876212 [Helianthus annuus]|uniref:uncharacterized protein LOC110876212 n=1 Tax=Helianthus annuus TaxID=4232 RepID=UPI000B902BD0|nr:uncharacterized protein LOC110876212 [Helianthus annuus]